MIRMQCPLTASQYFVIFFNGYGDPGGTRTPYLQIRNLSLYPDELRDHAYAVYSHSTTAARPIAGQKTQTIPHRLSHTLDNEPTATPIDFRRGVTHNQRR